MLSRVVFTSLSTDSAFLFGNIGYRLLALAGFPTFCPIVFHLFASYSLIASRSMDAYHHAINHSITQSSAGTTNLIIVELGIVHILSVVSHSARPDLYISVKQTLYQCFFTLPSVLVGNDFEHQQRHVSQSATASLITFAISLQPLFSPRICCNFCSSSGVHGVFVLPFFLVPDSGIGAGAVTNAASVAEEADVKPVGGE